ncbi:hypothetical protein [Methylosinus sporium]|uniref:hypothetical protein n=1 Tax=Methylosinus sporium TaxID=428 RepID=UPI00115D0461|nr:hypothetical protein [Methylosinus sporium]
MWLTPRDSKVAPTLLVLMRGISLVNDKWLVDDKRITTRPDAIGTALGDAFVIWLASCHALLTKAHRAA